MNLKSIVPLAIIVSSSQAVAIDTSLCPSSLSVAATVTRVNASSIYSKVPGWKEAQSTLSNNRSFRSSFRLMRKTQKSCIYGDRSNNTATLTTATLIDPEVSEGTTSNDIVILNYSIAGSSFVSYVAVKSYSISGVALWTDPSTQKIKTKLFSPDWNRARDFDLGMVAVQLR